MASKLVPAHIKVLGSFMDLIGVGVSVISSRMLVIFTNSQMKQWFPEISASACPLCHRVYPARPGDHVCPDCPAVKAFLDGQVHEITHDLSHRSSTVCRRILASPLGNRESVTSSVVILVQDISRQRTAEQALKDVGNELEMLKKLVREKDTALREIMDQIENYKHQIRREMQANVDKIVFPTLQTLGERLKPEDKGYLAVVRNSLAELSVPFASRLETVNSRLTSRDVRTCNMIKNGLSCKEIASALNLSVYTVYNQRRRIRKKLGIADKETNLASFLNTL